MYLQTVTFTSVNKFTDKHRDMANIVGPTETLTVAHLNRVRKKEKEFGKNRVLKKLLIFMRMTM